MRVSTVPLIVALSTAPLTAAQAGFAFFEKNATVDWFNDATFVQVPGQAVSQVANLGNTGGLLLPGSTVSETNCVVMPHPGCSGTAAVVKQIFDLTAAAPPLSGVSAFGTGIAGNDAVSMSLAASSAGAALSGVQALLYNIVGIDRQRLSFDVPLAGLPEFIDVDVTFSVIATITDRSAVSGAVYLAQASANLRVLEAATLLADPLTSGPMHAPLVANAAVNLSDPDDAVLMDVTETISVRPNAEYWVALESQTALSLVPSPGFVARDYAGLDIELYAYADPTFALNSDFAAANPDIAAALSINRIAVVPVPAALPLFLGGLAALGALASARRARSGSA